MKHIPALVVLLFLVGASTHASALTPNDGFLKDGTVRTLFSLRTTDTSLTGADFYNWMPALRIYSDGSVVVKYTFTNTTNLRRLSAMIVAKVSLGEISKFENLVHARADTLKDNYPSYITSPPQWCVTVEKTSRYLFTSCNTSDNTPADHRSLLQGAFNLMNAIPDMKWTYLIPSRAYARRVTTRCTSGCTTYNYNGPTIIDEDGVWINDVDSAQFLLSSIGDPQVQLYDRRGLGGIFQAAVIIPNLSVNAPYTISPPTSTYYDPYPSQSYSSPNLGLIVPLAVMGGITFFLVITMAICRRCKKQDTGYSVVETEATSNYPGESVQMDTFTPAASISPSPMLATAPTATVVPSNYAMPTYMVSNGTAMPQYYMVSNAGAPMSPIYTQPVQGGYILTYVPTQTNQ